MNLKEEEKGGTGKSYEFALSLSRPLTHRIYVFNIYHNNGKRKDNTRYEQFTDAFYTL